MNDRIEELLDEVIESELEKLKDSLESPEEKKITVDYLVKLNNIQTERKDNLRKDTEMELKHLELEDKIEFESTDRAFKKLISNRESLLTIGKYGIEVLGILVPIGFYSTWMKRGLEFEKEGSYTSATFKGLFGKFKPTK